MKRQSRSSAAASQQQNRKKKQQKIPDADTGSEIASREPLTQLVNDMLEQDKELLFSVPVADEPTQQFNGGGFQFPPPYTGLKECDSGQYWAPTYSSSTLNIPVILQGQDVVDEKTPIAPNAPLLFASVYNLTVSGSKRLNIGIETRVDREWCVVIEIENVAKGVKVRFTELEWDELCRAGTYIIQLMNAGYCPPVSSSQDIYCAALTLSITTAYDEPALRVKSGETSVYLQLPTVTNLFGLKMALSILLERLNRWLPSVKAVYRNIAEYLRMNNVHLDDLEQCVNMVSTETNGLPLSLREIHAEFCAYKKHLFSNMCTGVKREYVEDVMHPMYDY